MSAANKIYGSSHITLLILDIILSLIYIATVLLNNRFKEKDSLEVKDDKNKINDIDLDKNHLKTFILNTISIVCLFSIFFIPIYVIKTTLYTEYFLLFEAVIGTSDILPYISFVIFFILYIISAAMYFKVLRLYFKKSNLFFKHQKKMFISIS